MGTKRKLLTTFYKYPAGPFLGDSDMIRYTLSADRHGMYYLTLNKWIGSETTNHVILKHGIFTPEELGYLQKNRYIPLYFISGIEEYVFFPNNGYCIGQWYAGHDRILESRLYEIEKGIYSGNRITFTLGGWSR